MNTQIKGVRDFDFDFESTALIPMITIGYGLISLRN